MGLSRALEGLQMSWRGEKGRRGKGKAQAESEPGGLQETRGRTRGCMSELVCRGRMRLPLHRIIIISLLISLSSSNHIFSGLVTRIGHSLLPLEGWRPWEIMRRWRGYHQKLVSGIFGSSGSYIVDFLLCDSQALRPRSGDE